MKKISSVSWQCIGMRLPAGIDWIDIVNAVAGMAPRRSVGSAEPLGAKVATLRAGVARVAGGLETEDVPVLAPVGKSCDTAGELVLQAVIASIGPWISPPLSELRIAEFGCLRSYSSSRR